MVRLREIAEACNVSVATVSRALNGLTSGNQRRTAMILKTAREMGYYPNAAARTLKTSRSHNIGILYEDMMNHEYFSTLINALRWEADARGYDLTLISNARGDGENYYDFIRRRNLDGVVVIRTDFESAEVVRLAASAIPSVIIDHLYEGCNCVSNDNRASVEEIIRYAWKKGHRHFAFISGEPGDAANERLTGFYKICAELGIRVPETCVREGRFHDPELCTAIIHELMEKDHDITCILCPDDYSCLGSMMELIREGFSIPERISLVGYDGIPISGLFRPRLTTYCQDTEKIAREAIRLLLDAIDEPESHQFRLVRVRGRLVEGETVRELSADKAEETERQ